MPGNPAHRRTASATTGVLTEADADASAGSAVLASTAESGFRAFDADVLTDRLRGRVQGYLTGEGRHLIEARCRDALQDHTTWLIHQITREVAMALETEMAGWVRDAVNDELNARANPGSAS